MGSWPWWLDGWFSGLWLVGCMGRWYVDDWLLGGLFWWMVGLDG